MILKNGNIKFTLFKEHGDYETHHCDAELNLKENRQSIENRLEPSLFVCFNKYNTEVQFVLLKLGIVIKNATILHLALFSRKIPLKVFLREVTSRFFH